MHIKKAIILSCPILLTQVSSNRLTIKMEAIRYFLVSIFLFCGKTNSDELSASSLQKSVTSPSFGIISIENNKLSTSFPNLRIPTLLRNISDKDYNLPINNLSAERLFDESDYEASAKELS